MALEHIPLRRNGPLWSQQRPRSSFKAHPALRPPHPKPCVEVHVLSTVPLGILREEVTTKNGHPTTQRDNVDFNLAYIGRDFDMKLPLPFNQAYMRALFDYGYQKAIHGYDWAKKPPLPWVNL